MVLTQDCSCFGGPWRLESVSLVRDNVCDVVEVDIWRRWSTLSTKMDA